jgi:O-antigen ligase
MRSHDSRVVIPFILFAAALIYGVLTMGVAVSQVSMEGHLHRDFFLLAVGFLGVAAAIAGWRPSEPGDSAERAILIAAVALPCYALFQFIPLPAAFVTFLSPARRELLRGIEPIVGHRSFASVSIVPAATFNHFLLFSGYCVVFFAVREFARRLRSPWVIAAPVVLVATIEAILGLAQFFAGGEGKQGATGTYAIREHLGGLLEMALPLAAMYSAYLIRDIWRRDAEGVSAIPQALAALAVSGLLLAGALFTLSRGTFLSVLTSALVIGSFGLTGSASMRKRLAIMLAILTCSVISLFFLTPIELLSRLSEHSSAGRTAIWRDIPGAIAAYPVFGCGLGGFESALLKFKDTVPTLVIDYAHNDYLQLLTELGIAGFSIAAVLFGTVVTRVAIIATTASRERWIALACLGSLAAILTHSMVDFNLYIPANAAVLAWICGLGSGLTPSEPRERPDSTRDRVIEVLSASERQSRQSL